MGFTLFATKIITEYFQSSKFKYIDDILDSGLYSGFITIGAISSLGKITFCLQLTDNIAKNEIVDANIQYIKLISKNLGIVIVLISSLIRYKKAQHKSVELLVSKY